MPTSLSNRYSLPRRVVRMDAPEHEHVRVVHQLASEPAFRVLTVDGTGWIDPYTGTVVPAPAGYLDAAKDHLLRTRPWTRNPPKTLHELRVCRWLHFLRQRVREEPRLRIFTRDGYWLNPFSGVWQRVAVPGGRVTMATLQEIAQQLAQDARLDEAQLLPAATLSRIPRPSASGDPFATAALPPVAAPLREPTPATPEPVIRDPDDGRATQRIEQPARAEDPADRIPTESVRRDRAPLPRDDEATDRLLAQAAARQRAATRAAAEAAPRVVPPAPPPTQDAPLPPGVDETALHRAKRVIDKMLPRLPQLPRHRLAVHYEPLTVIGGDFYDCIPMADERLFIAVGDVSGHGPEAALMVASTLKALRFIVDQEDDLAHIVATLNDNIQGDLLHEHFVTLFAAIVDTETDTLDCVCAGHHAAILASLRRRALLTQIGQHGMALGMAKGERFRTSLRPQRVQLAPGDLLVQCTDGLFEARDANDDEYGRLRAISALVARLEQPVAELPAALVAGAKAFAGRNLADDVTVLALGIGDDR